MSPRLIYVIRHGEKPSDQSAHASEDPAGVDVTGRVNKHSLTPRGWQRSGAIAVLFTRPAQPGMPALFVPDRLLCPDYGDTAKATEHRAYQTLLGLSDAIEQPIESRYPLGDEPRLAAALIGHSTHATDTPGAVVLICWEHKNIPRITAGIPTDQATPVPTAWPDDRFDLIWQFRKTSTEHDLYRFAQFSQNVLGDIREDLLGDVVGDNQNASAGTDALRQRERQG